MPSVWMPPDALARPYAGNLTVVDYHYRGGAFLASSLRSAGDCTITAPVAGGPISPALRKALYLVELGHCNQGEAAYQTPDPNDGMRVHRREAGFLPPWAHADAQGWDRQWQSVDLDALCARAGGCR